MKNHKLMSLSMISLFMVAGTMVQAGNDTAVNAVVVSADQKQKNKNKNRNSNQSEKPAKKCNKPDQNHENREGSEKQQGSEKSGKGCMHRIDRELDRIQADFKSGAMSKEQANAALDKIPGKIEKAVAKMKNSEEHGSMWIRHQNKMKSKLAEIRRAVNGKQGNKARKEAQNK